MFGMEKGADRHAQFVTEVKVFVEAEKHVAATKSSVFHYLYIN